MSGIYTKLLAHDRQGSAGAFLPFTNAGGTTIVLRDLELSSSAPSSSVRVQLFDGTLAYIFLSVTSTVGVQAYQWQGRLVVPAGWSLRWVLADSNAAWTLLVTGYDLS